MKKIFWLMLSCMLLLVACSQSKSTSDNSGASETTLSTSQSDDSNSENRSVLSPADYPRDSNDESTPELKEAVKKYVGIYTASQTFDGAPNVAPVAYTVHLAIYEDGTYNSYSTYEVVSGQEKDDTSGRPYVENGNLQLSYKTGTLRSGPLRLSYGQLEFLNGSRYSSSIVDEKGELLPIYISSESSLISSWGAPFIDYTVTPDGIVGTSQEDPALEIKFKKEDKEFEGLKYTVYPWC